MGLYQGRYQHQRLSSQAGWRQGVAKAGLTCAVTGLLFTAGYMPTHEGWRSCVGAAYGESLTAGKSIDLELADADLQMVVGLLQRKTGAEIVVQSGDKPFSKVNVNLTHASLEKALRNVALSANAVLSRDNDGVYILRPAQNGASGNVDGETPVGSAVSYRPNSQMPAQAEKLSDVDLHWYKIVLQYAVPRDVLHLTGWDDNPREVRPFEVRTPTYSANTSNNAGVVTMNGDSVIPPSVQAGQGGIGADAANRSVQTDDANQAHQFPGGGGGGFGGGGGGFGGGGGGFGGGGGGFGGGGRGGIGGGGLGGQNGAAQLPEGVNKIIALQADNSLLIQATPEAYQRIREIVKNIDIAPRQVQIKVEFITAQVNDVDQFGINFDFLPYPGISADAPLGTGKASSYGISIASGNLVAELRANLSNGRSKTIQSPVITTTNNVQATIFQNQQIPYTTSTNIVGNNTNTTNTTTQFLQVTTQLSVTPRINNDDTVTLALSPQISTPGAAVAGSPPPVTTQGIQALRTIHSGETMVLGGLINNFDTSTSQRIPILSDLPIIGSLFRNRDKSVTNSELLIFVTPTILDYAGNATAGAVGPNAPGSVTP
ncbi:hypothetical protein CCAX7_33050 [Capsulimonas corticalis]|uniref:Uncharacterized protein n=1 Tax=Capsulimonas corticalis TaxID=2219043 RepID=A0A402CYT4_9BACT|nr:secretin N-terminal domain-containing protein [Capsulimonas corticalis]BDI31254.1 hypothetical protein CCAX7_33050 [Capsulimonas corticalis]